jgi:hypothetical protein
MGSALLFLGIFAFLLLMGGRHARHYRKHRRAGFGFWYSIRGPFGTRETISKRW